MKIKNNIKFFNDRKLERAKTLGGDDDAKVLEEYVRMGGYFEELEPNASPKEKARKTPKPRKKAVKKAVKKDAKKKA